MDSTSLQENDIKSAMNFSFFSKTFKIILALIICYLYFTNNGLIEEFIIFGVIVTLVLPLNFFDVFIQKLLEYNTQKVEERQILNANEANKTFTDFQDKIEKIELELEILKNENR